MKAVLADGPRPSRTTRQYPRYEEITDPEERRLAVIHLHAQGWSISTIARYLDVSRPTIYAILKRLSSRKEYAVSLTNRERISASQGWICRRAT